MTWHDVVVQALRNCGGLADLTPQLYSEVQTVAAEAGKKLPRTWKALVRDTLEAGCPECPGFHHRGEFFRMLDNGKGRWALRNYKFPDLETLL